MKIITTILIFVFSAILEINGDALIRKGLRGSGILFISIGFITIGLYGVLINVLKWDFSRLLGVYVSVFAFISVLFGKFLFKEQIPITTWIGIVIILIGGMTIQFGTK
jgi:small multidrug resistance family-3 protein